MRKILPIPLTLIALAAPRAAFACAVCFGQNDSPLAAGINAGIFLMLGIIGALWLAFGSFFIYLRRRAKRLHLAHAQEGTL